MPIADNEISQRVPRTNERRPNPLYTTNLLISNDAEAWYDGVELAWDKRFSRGLQFQVSYTFSNSEDTTSEATFVGAGDSNQQGPNDIFAREVAVPHPASIHLQRQLPTSVLRGRARVSWAGVGRMDGRGCREALLGTPFTVTAPTVDLEFDGFAEARPVLLDPSVLGAHVDHRDTSRKTLPATAFRPARYGDSVEDLVPRNSFYGDGLERVDLALSNVFQMPWSSHSLDFRFEAFNVFNHVQFGFPDARCHDATFAAITGVATPIPRGRCRSSCAIVTSEHRTAVLEGVTVSDALFFDAYRTAPALTPAPRALRAAHHNMIHVLGIDAGGTKTVCQLADEKATSSRKRAAAAPTSRPSVSSKWRRFSIT